jgi:hypothetical protein
MTEEEKRKYNADRTRRYRARHRDDQLHKLHTAEITRKWCVANREKLAAQARERYHNNPARKLAACVQAKTWHEKHPERWLAAQKAWRAANREKLKRNSQRHADKIKQNSEQYAEHRNKRIIRMRAYYQINKEKLKEQQLKRLAKKPELRTAVLASRRARKKSAMPKWADRKAVAAFYRMAKAKTKETGIDWHVDHIIPLKHKLVCGLHIPQNLQLLQSTENKIKNNSFIIE